MNWNIELSVVGLDGTSTQTLAIGTKQSGWTLVTERQSGQIFYRTKLNGTLRLQGTDYSWLYEQWNRLTCCAEVDIRIFTPNCDSSAEELFWHGYFNMQAVKFNHSDCAAEVSQTNPRDLYDAFFRVWTKPVNMVQTPINFPFRAKYEDRYSWQPRASDGQMEKVLPDGNKKGDAQQHLYPKGFRIQDVLAYMVRTSVDGSRAADMAMLGCMSQFYTADVNPVNRRPNNMKLLVAGSDAKRPASEQPAVKLDISLKDLLDDLRSLHNVWWHIDPVTKALVVEHLSYYPAFSYTSAAPVTFNLNRWPTALTDNDNEFVDLDSLFGEEELVISNNAQSDYHEFKRGNVVYNDTCILRNDDGTLKKNTMTVQRIYTDLMAGYAYPDSVPDSAILLVEVAYTGYAFPDVVSYSNFEYYLDFGQEFILNGTQTAARLFADFHRHGRSFSAGLVNQLLRNDGSYSVGVQMLMASVKPTRKREGVEIGLCCEDLPLNLSGYIVTNRFQKGELSKATFNPDDDTLTMDVLGESRCTTIVVTPSTPGSECAPAGLLLREEIEIETCENNPSVIQSQGNYGIFADGNCGEVKQLLYSTGPYQC